MTRRIGVLVLAIAVTVGVATCKQEETATDTTTTDTSGPVAGTASLDTAMTSMTALEKLSISDTAMVDIIERARKETGDPVAQSPRAYVQEFDENFRRELEKKTGRKLDPLSIDDESTADKMYAQYADMIRKRDYRAIAGGDEEAAVPRKEVVSLKPEDDQCTGIIIALNAIATALHCDGAKSIHMGMKSTSGPPLCVNPVKFHRVPSQKGKLLDMAVYVCKTDLPDVTAATLPVFASDAMIRNAKEFSIVGFGGYTAAAQLSGVKRLGIVPKLSSDCSGPDEETNYKCVPDYEIVAGRGPLEDRIACTLANAQTACDGDSGGPAYIEAADGKLYLAGIMRTNDKCACGKATTVFVRVDKQKDFLKGLTDVRFASASFVEVDKP